MDTVAPVAGMPMNWPRRVAVDVTALPHVPIRRPVIHNRAGVWKGSTPVADRPLDDLAPGQVGV